MSASRASTALLALLLAACTPYQRQEAKRDLAIFIADVKKVADGAKEFVDSAAECDPHMLFDAAQCVSYAASGDYVGTVSCVLNIARCLYHAAKAAAAGAATP